MEGTPQAYDNSSIIALAIVLEFIKLVHKNLLLWTNLTKTCMHFIICKPNSISVSVSISISMLSAITERPYKTLHSQSNYINFLNILKIWVPYITHQVLLKSIFSATAFLPQQNILQCKNANYCNRSTHPLSLKHQFPYQRKKYRTIIEQTITNLLKTPLVMCCQLTYPLTMLKSQVNRLAMKQRRN